MIAQKRYRSVAAMGWTRIDMLLALYAALLKTLMEGENALIAGKTREVAVLRSRACHQLLGLISGIDLEQGEIPQDTMRLLIYVWDEVACEECAAWSRAHRIVSTLEQSFAAIADEARVLERDGVIPRLEV